MLRSEVCYNFEHIGQGIILNEELLALFLICFSI